MELLKAHGIENIPETTGDFTDTLNELKDADNGNAIAFEIITLAESDWRLIVMIPKINKQTH